MHYSRELDFLLGVLKKCRVRTVRTTRAELSTEIVRSGLSSGAERALPKARKDVADKTVYLYTDELGLSYLYFALPGAHGELLLIGPYLSEPITERAVLEAAELCAIPPSQQRYVNEFFSSLPVLSDDNALFVMLDSFFERIFETPAFQIVSYGRENDKTSQPPEISTPEKTLDDTMIDVRAMEKRYELENELMDAVSLGQIHKEKQFLISMNGGAFEKRLSDAARNAKNYGIIMNTLLRKSAERGGVHPIYLDRTSSDFASKIEASSSTADVGEVMKEMFRSYCGLVRNCSMKGYSTPVAKALIMIDSDLCTDLSLSTLAKAQSISGGYLSSIFKKEVGETVSEYIRSRRMKRAMQLLSTTNLQIQTVALHCGIVDVQYFSKTFKKETGMTPKEYRETYS